MINANAPLLEMKNIKKDFFGNQVLTDINLTLMPGEVLGLCGENGAGRLREGHSPDGAGGQYRRYVGGVKNAEQDADHSLRPVFAWYVIQGVRQGLAAQ